jgi:site-specific DNA-cytosine methylase
LSGSQTDVGFENVDAIDDKVSSNTETNLSLLMNAMKDLGYEGQKIMTDGQEFGLPCRRRRLYVMFIGKKAAR